MPPPFDPREATIQTVQDAIFNRVNTCREIVESFLCRIEALNHLVNAIICLNHDALSEADRLDEAFAEGHASGALFGVPILLKDNYDLAGIPNTGGCLSLADSIPSKDAPIVRTLKKAGAIILGKTNLHEFALEGLSVSSLGGQTMNPYDMTRTAGGSSGGSSAAIAMSFAVFATGSDTMNSLRNPASACNLYSIRPTHGRIPTKGVIPVSQTQDALGPIARSVEDLAIALEVMSATREAEISFSTAADVMTGVDYTSSLKKGGLHGLRIGLLEGFLDHTDDPEVTPVDSVIQATIEQLIDAGSSIVSITESIYDAPTILRELDTQRYEYRELLTDYLCDPDIHGDHPKSFEELYAGKDFLVIPAQYEYIKTASRLSTRSSAYRKVKAGVEDLKAALERTFEYNKLDVIVYPQQKNLVVKIGAPSQSRRNGILAALTGCPSIAIPVGFSPPTSEAPDGVPIGMEILGRRFNEQKLLQVAWQLHQLKPTRRVPAAAQRTVERRRLRVVPEIVPHRSNIAQQYPLGAL